MKTTINLSSLGAASVLVFLGAFTNLANAQTWTPLDDPLGPGTTQAFGISDSGVVGGYTDGGGTQHGFSYNGSGFTTLDDPLGSSAYGSQATGISGGNIVGYYTDANSVYHGFLHSGTTYTTIMDPLASLSYLAGGTSVSGIYGSDIVGYYLDSNDYSHGFFYNGSTYTTLDDPSSALQFGGTVASGISGSNIVGYYFDSNAEAHGFLYNGMTYTTLDDPLAQVDVEAGTFAIGVDGNNVVGYYIDSQFAYHGFLYNGTTYTALDDPKGVNGTFAYGISGTSIVGYYNDSGLSSHGFLLTSGPPPAPASLTATPGNELITLKWSASLGATSYNIYMGTTSGGESPFPMATDVTTRNYTNLSLTNGVTYYYLVAAVNANGTSPYSNEASATPNVPPIAPTGLTATPGNAEVTLNWSASAGATSYDLYTGTTSGGEKLTPFATGVKSTHYSNTHLTNGKTYYYKVAAVNSAATSEYSNEASATPEAPPAPPTNLTATAGNAQVTLNWTASAGATSYSIYSGTSAGGEKAKPFATGVKSTHYLNTHLTNGVTYYYKVVAVSANGASAYSSEASATPVLTGASTGRVRSYLVAAAFW